MRYRILLIVCILNISCFEKPTKSNRPKLVIGVVVDQMRAEYLYRFQDNYTEDGFNRLLREGFNVKNIHYNYIPTSTAPGHTSIFTGTTPSNHGIIGNYWYDRDLNKKVYCVEDTTVFLVDNPGVVKNKNAQPFLRSPKNIKTTTITDELKLFTNHRSKVIGLSLKDRGAVCPSGHLSDGTYWYNTLNGNFITSSFYKKQLPEWLKEFNSKNKADSILNTIWEPLLSIEKYTNSEPDNTVYEKILKGKIYSTFPYNLKKLRKDNGDFKLMIETPQGNTLLTDLAIETVKKENLGNGKETDFLTISYSATDYVGHYFGIRSKELEDTYVRLDRDIARLFNALDKQLGEGSYILFLTSDHGASDNPSFLRASGLPGWTYSTKKLKKDLNKHISQQFGDANYIAFVDKTQLYLNKTNVPKELVVKEAVSFLKTIDGINNVYAPGIAEWNIDNSPIGNFVKNSYKIENSGDILFHFDSGWMEERKYGANHSTIYTSDTHVPLLLYGWNIQKGETVKPYAITQIAPTLSMLLDIPLPNASDKRPIEEIFEQ